MIGLKLRVKDVYGETISDIDRVLVRYRNRSGQKLVRLTRENRKRMADGWPLHVVDLDDGLVDITVYSQHYRTARQFVTLKGAWPKSTFTLLVKPRRVVAKLPNAGRIASHHAGVFHLLKRSQVEWSSLRPIQQACLLNIAAKSAVSPIGQWRDVLGKLVLREVRQDRIFVHTSRDAANRVAKHWKFAEVSGALHEPPHGFELYSSFKTHDVVGNLQVTFFRRLAPDDTESGRLLPPFMADVDIDNAGGLAHVFDVVRHHITGKMTHPFDIHDILVRWQGVDPGYTLVPKP